jgi:hypothetical protein
LKEATAGVNDVLECISIVRAELQDGAVKAQIGIHLRRFEVEVMPEAYLHEICEKLPVEALVADYARVIDKQGIGQCVSSRCWHAGI